MPVFEVQGPDGGIYEVEASDESHALTAFGNKPEANTAEDVGKSLAAGVGRGVASIPGFAGDVQELAKMAPWAPKRSMLDAILEKTGYKLPTSKDVVDKAAEYVPGLNYQSQTDAGKYAGKIGEFLPNAVGGEGNLVGKAIKYGVAPAVGSQLGEDYAGPLGGIAGAVAGGVVGGNMRLPGTSARAAGYQKGFLKQDPNIAAHVSELEQAGVGLTAGQKTGNSKLQWAEDVAQKFPGGGGDITDRQRGELQKAMFKKAGVDSFLETDTNQFTPDTWLRGDDYFKDWYDRLNSNSKVVYNPTLNAKLGGIERDYHSWRNATGPMTGVTNWFEKIRDIGVNGGELSGRDAQQWRSELVKARKGLQPNTAEFKAVDRLAKLLDESLQQNTPTQFKPHRDRINREYSNYKLLEEASKAAGSTSGFVSPAIARGLAARRNQSAYARGTSDIGELAKAAEHVMKQKPSSGTAERAGYIGAIGGATGPVWLIKGAALSRLLMSQKAQQLLGGGYRPARAARAATSIDRDAIIRAGIMGLLSGNQ